LHFPQNIDAEGNDDQICSDRQQQAPVAAFAVACSSLLHTFPPGLSGPQMNQI
jgi:hypothetical protein